MPLSNSGADNLLDQGPAARVDRVAIQSWIIIVSGFGFLLLIIIPVKRGNGRRQHAFVRQDRFKLG